MKQLLIFIGKPGVGKSTLISQLNDTWTRVDVMPFVRQYIVDGKLQEDKTIDAYREMYGFLKEELAKGDTVILELGTNHVDLNIEELCTLQEENNLSVFLCDAPTEICRQRAIARDRDIDPDSLKKRLKRDFPNAHVAVLKERNIPFVLLNMEEPLEVNIEIVQLKLV